VLKAAPSAVAIGRLSLRRLEGLLIGASRGRLGAQKAKALRESATQSLAAGRQDPALDLLICTMITQLEFFENQLAELDVHIQRLFSRMQHPIKTIPGIGSITGPLIAAELGDLRRFEGRRPLHAILAYAGMDPRVRKSGQWSGKIKMSKRGSTALPTALYQAATMARLHEPGLPGSNLQPPQTANEQTSRCGNQSCRTKTRRHHLCRLRPRPILRSFKNMRSAHLTPYSLSSFHERRDGTAAKVSAASRALRMSRSCSKFVIACFWALL